MIELANPGVAIKARSEVGMAKIKLSLEEVAWCREVNQRFKCPKTFTLSM
jgi:hypothetical protein